MGASLCVKRVALAQNLGLEYLRSCDTQLDRTAILFLSQMFVKISKDHRLMTDQDFGEWFPEKSWHQLDNVFVPFVMMLGRPLSPRVLTPMEWCRMLERFLIAQDEEVIALIFDSMVASKVGTTNRRGDQAVSVTKLRKFHALFSDAWTAKAANSDTGGNSALAEELRFLTKGDKDNVDDEGETFTLDDMYFFCKRNLKVFEPIRFIHTYLRHNLLTASYWVDLRNKWMDELDVMIAASGNKRTRPQAVVGGGGAFSSRSIDVALPACFMDVVGREKTAKAAPGILVHANQRSRVAMVRPAGIETGMSVRFGETRLCLYDADEEPNTPTKLSYLSTPPPTASLVRTLGRTGPAIAVLPTTVSTASTLIGNGSPLVGGSPGSMRKVSDVMLEPASAGTFEIVSGSPRAGSPLGSSSRHYPKRSHSTPRSKLSAV